MVRSALRGDICGYCNACVRIRLCAARGRSPEPLECAYKHILESYGKEKSEKLLETPKPVCASCRWTSDAQFPESPPSSSDLSLEWSSQSSHRPRTRRRKR
ncbi:uncharacterized protein LOC120630591 [Pararge aegeria]|uniref:Jg25313 protein n=1 Tax=Pararge aegeria aegeria TaxID=348720 RepID=A0A8S4S1X7_9NEOP|nr:uncharacterized protein LOC120630591 [Pararge aegeria]CAH2244362.1 jg25313 [Pararge aegeria aegeria]